MPKGSRLLILTLLAASSLIIMAGATVAPVLPALRQHFAYMPDADILVSLVLTLPALTIAFTAPFMGFVADKFGRSRLLLVGLLMFVVSGVSGYLAQSLFSMLVGRIGIGVAVAAIMTAASALLIDHSQGAARHRVVGYQGAAAGLSGLFFPVIAGMLAEGGWRLPFLVYLAPVILIPLVATCVHDVSKPSEDAHVATTEFPLRKVAKVYALAFFWMVVMYAIPLQVAHHLQSIGSGSPTVLGLAVGLPSLAAALASFAFGTLKTKLSTETLVSAAFGYMALGYAVVAAAANLPAILFGLVIAGTGFGLAMPTLIGWLQSEMPHALRGRAAGGYTTATFLGQFSATFVYAELLSRVGPAASFSIGALACLGIALLLVFSSSLSRRMVHPMPAQR
jgi:MFS family permease